MLTLLFWSQVTIFWMGYCRLSAVAKPLWPSTGTDWRFLSIPMSAMETTPCPVGIYTSVVSSFSSTPSSSSSSGSGDSSWPSWTILHHHLLSKIVLSRCFEHLVWHWPVWKTPSAFSPYLLKHYTVSQSLYHMALCLWMDQRSHFDQLFSAVP